MTDYTLHHGDCLEVMAGMEAGSVDAVVTDPPYGLKFMGKHWDHGLPGVDFWTEVIRVLAPSHYLLAFGGTRTWHRLACALEDAGFEIRDTLMWLYGSGFPKGRACLKPAWEPVILARKPGPMQALGIDECRIDTGDVTGWGGGKNGDSYSGFTGDAAAPRPAHGRWPANVILDEEAAGMVDEQTGKCRSSGLYPTSYSNGIGYGNWSPTQGPLYADSGGPSRFFKTVPGPSPCGDHVPCGECINREDCDYAGDYACPVPGCHGTGMHFCPQDDSEPVARFKYVPKASRRERNAGLEGMEARQRDLSRHADQPSMNGGEGNPYNRGAKRVQNHHPTVKPVALMSWLVRLVARPGDVVLDPFTGSGTTGVACIEEGRDFIGIEREAEYVEISRRRIEAAAAQLRMDVTA